MHLSRQRAESPLGMLGVPDANIATFTLPWMFGIFRTGYRHASISPTAWLTRAETELVVHDNKVEYRAV